MSDSRRGIRAGIRRLFRLDLNRVRDARAGVDDEIALHLEARAAQLVASGMAPEMAGAEARRLFGDVDGARRELRAAAERRMALARLRDRLDSLRADVLYVLRSLRRNPAFSAAVVVTFALGIGANTAMFGVTERLLLRGPEHVKDRDRLARLYLTMNYPVYGERTQSMFGYVSYAILRDQARLLDGVGAYSGPGEARFGTGADHIPVQLAHATWDFFPLLGVRPALGRFFDPSEDRPPDGQRVVVLDFGFWHRQFAGDPGVIGRTVRIRNEPYTVIGVAPRGFTGVELSRVDAWVPMSLIHPTDNWAKAWNAQWLQVIGRVKAGVTQRAAAAEALAIHRRNYQSSWMRSPFEEGRLSFRPILYDESGSEPPEVAVLRWLIGVALVVLLIACANVANLLLARAVTRRREIAVRVAMGISRWRLARLLLAESVVLAFVGAVLGMGIAYGGVALLRRGLLPWVAWTSTPVDARVFLFGVGLASVVGIATGLAPALRTRRFDLTEALKSGSRQTGTSRSRLSSALLVAQAALSVALLVGAGLFVRSLVNVRRVDLGFTPDRVLEVWISSPREEGGYPDSALRRERDAYAALLERLRATPGVAHAALAIGSPFGAEFGVSLRVPGRDTIPDLGSGPFVSAVTPGFFEATGMRLREGRWFTEGDRAGSERVVVVNATMAKTLWPGGRALGECLHIFDLRAPCSRVVGVVDDVHRNALRESPAMQYYVPFGQESGIGGTALLVRPAGDMDAFRPALDRVVREVAPTMYANIATKQERIDPLVRPWRVGTILFLLFGVLALAIAAVGLYSVISYMVARRTQEFGVRLALGATGGRLVAHVLRRGVSLASAGLLGGIGIALAAGRFLEPLLFDTSGRDPLVIGGATAVLLCVAIFACALPALHAAHTDPLTALREE